MMAWLQLARVSNLPSALSNILMAHWLATGEWGDLRALACLLVASAACYSAGMILNDWADLDRDRSERPDRPLPSGRISRRQAMVATVVLFCLALACAALAGGVGAAAFNPRPVVITGGLVAAVWLYDVVWKRYWIAPWLMGTCRGLNILLGASIGAEHWPLATAPAGFPPIVWSCAVGWVLYTTGVTYVARREADEAALHGAGQRRDRGLGVGCMAVAFAVFIGSFYWATPAMGSIPGRLSANYAILIGVIALVVLGRGLVAVIQPTRRAVGQAVVTALRSMLTIDAAICWAASQGELVPPLIILGLLGVALMLAPISRST